MDYTEICPPVIIQAVRDVDLGSDESSTLIMWAQNEAGSECAIAVLCEVARRLSPDSDFSVIDLFWDSVATYAPMLDGDQIETVRLTYLRIPYSPAFSSNYFLGLRQTGIDIRARLRNRVPVNWDFSSIWDSAGTWNYYLYLATLNEPGALEIMAKKIKETESGNDVTSMLRSLSEIPVDGVDDILRMYLNDTRRADGVNGPGLPVSDSAAYYLGLRQSR